MSMTRDEMVTAIRFYMDASEDEGRWNNTIILQVLDSVFDTEWSRLLGVAPYYRFATRSVTTTSAGVFPLDSSLNSGSGDSAQKWYRIITITDSQSVVYVETRFQDVPIALTTNYQNVFGRLWYLAGSNAQLLPIGTLTLSVSVNYKPPLPSDLSAGSVTVDYPDGSEMVLVWETAGRLLLKGGAEQDGASPLFQLAEQTRARMLADLQRRSINPVRMMPVDDAVDWASY